MKISVVTPSFNQGRYLERTIRSVLGQTGDFELEYVVVDGGSTDETLSILERYRHRLSFTSGPDSGQVDAIQKGFARTSGEIVAWLNSDDLYLPGALQRVVETLREPHLRWCFGQCRIIDEEDRRIRRGVEWYKNRLSRRYSLERLLVTDFIPQPATFFRRDLLDQAGGLDESFRLAMDYELWLRFARISQPAFVPVDLAAFRWHGASKSSGGYGRAAWEAYEAARRNAQPQERHLVRLHALHARTFVACYRVLELLEPVLRRTRSLAASRAISA